jgi:hypothetical protein
VEVQRFLTWHWKSCKSSTFNFPRQISDVESLIPGVGEIESPDGNGLCIEGRILMWSLQCEASISNYRVAGALLGAGACQPSRHSWKCSLMNFSLTTISILKSLYL